MATNDTGNIGALGATNAANTTNATGKRNEQIGKNEFMTLLVTQLKNQDPLNPMDNQQFAVQLAQFSQLEQLTSINDKIGKSNSSFSDIGSLTGYLGKEVTLDSQAAHVESGDGGLIKFDLPTDTNEVTIQLLNSDNSVAETHKLGGLKKGKQTVMLDGLTSENGDYAVKVLADGTAGGQYEPPVSIAGVVSGLVPGPDPTLMVGGREVKPSEIKEVTLPTQK